MAMQVPVVASIQQAPNGFVQHWVMQVIQLPPWDAHTYYQPCQAAEFHDRVWMGDPWMGDPQAQKAQWQRGGSLVADIQSSCPPSDGESTKAPSSPRSGPSSRHVPIDSDDSAPAPALSSTGRPRHRRSSTRESHLSRGRRLNAQAFGLSAYTESHVSVVLGGLPKMLCSTKCFEAAIEQACCDTDVVAFEVEMIGGVGEAVVILRTESAAQHCIRHFTGLRCSQSMPITARYNAEAGRRLMARRNGARSARDEPPSYEQEASKVVPNLRKKTRKITSNHQSVLELDTLAMRNMQREDAATSCPREPETCEEVAKATTPTQCIVVPRPPGARSLALSAINSPMKSKKLWADYDDDVDDYEGRCYWSNQSTLVPLESEFSPF